MSSPYKRAKEFFAVRTNDEAARTFTAAECPRQAERQKARYGKTYRASIQFTPSMDSFIDSESN